MESSPHQPRYHILINARSGTAGALGREKIEDLIKNSALGAESFDFLEPGDFHLRMQDLLKSPVPILVGGGDGTIAKTAALHLKQKKTFGILPFGTMNLLARDLGLPLDFQQSLAAHRYTKVVSIDVGLVNDVPFLCCAALGTMPEAAEFREENRDAPDYMLMPRLTAYIFSQLDKTLQKQIRLTLDGRSRMINTGMLIVSNNRYNPESPQGPFRKDTLQEGVFGIYTVSPHNFMEKARLLVKMKSGQWRKDPAVRETRARNVIVETENATELISIDGEPVEMEMPLKFTLLPRALEIIVPLIPFNMNKVA
jgi:diacylglycerol kinase family enzyme